MIGDDNTWPDEYTVPPWLGTRKPLNLVAGTPTTGLWCDTCLLPSRYEVALYAFGDGGPYQIATYSFCDGHQS